MATEIHQALVIKMINYADYDQIVTVLTAKEHISFMALGVRKITSKNRIALQLGNIIEIEIFRARLTNKLSKLKRATLLKQLPLHVADTAKVWINIIAMLQKLEKPSLKLFNAIVEVYPYFGEEFNHHAQSYIWFYSLDALGLLPVMHYCVDCYRQDHISDFNFDKGGFLCHDHALQERSLAMLKAFKALGQSMADYILIDPKLDDDLFQEMSDFIKNHNLN